MLVFFFFFFFSERDDIILCFFFQAEDGIRDYKVTGVQTCALPICAVAKELDSQWSSKGVRVFYVPDLYFKEKQQAHAYEVSHGLPTHDVHAGTDDTSELMALDAQHRWIRVDKLAPSEGAQSARTGVDGDPTKASAALGNIFLQYKIDDAVEQIHRLLPTAGRAQK